MEIASGEVRINGRQVFINNAEVSGLKPMPPKHYVRRQASSQNAPAPVGTAPALGGKGAQRRLALAKYWTDRARAKQYNAQYHGKMALNSHNRPVYEYTDCGRFVHQIVHADDPHFPDVGTHTMKPYIERNWAHGAISEGGGPQPGDVLIVNNSHAGHTAIYGGRDADGKYIVYNASLGGHGPIEQHKKSLNFFEIWGRPPG